MTLIKNNIRYFINPIYQLPLFVFLLNANFLFAQPVADFSATPLSGCTPLTVSFADKSTGNPTSWSWNLGNGITSPEKNPTTTFFTAGVYNVRLTVTNASGSNSITKNQFITVYAKPTVNFTVNDSSTCIPANLKFTDLSKTSIGAINSWRWDFDDGTFSSVQSPQHNYNTAGDYNITLKVTNTGGCSNTFTKLSYIKAIDSIRTVFSFTQPTKCKPPETISFTNNTVGPGVLRFLWDFGDNTSSTSGSPNHTYSQAGVFSIKLTVTNNFGCKDSLVLKDTLVLKNVKSSFTSADTICTNTNLSLTNTSAPRSLSSSWYFSDGTFAFGNSPTKKWSNSGVYKVKLINNYSSCIDSVTKNITVINLPIANLKSDDSNSCRIPFTVHFSDLSANAVKWLWTFGDGNTSAEKNPTNTYKSEGEFDVKLDITDRFGCSGIRGEYHFIMVAKPEISIDTAEGGGCIPYVFKPVANIFSPDSVVSYFWDFGNGSTSNLKSPSTTYTALGNYAVKFKMKTIDGCEDSTTLENAVKIGTMPVVNFGLAPNVVCPGQNVQFTDSSVSVDRWEWKFGDGNTSALKNPQNAYFDTGNVVIKLIAWNNGCSDSISKSRLVKVLPGAARFKPLYNCDNKLEVFFSDSSILPESWLWDFADGTTSTSQNPTHLFSRYDEYQVSLTTKNSTCTNKKILPVKLVNETPDFRASNNWLCKSDSVIFYFANFKKENITSYKWDYGDGTVDSTQLDSIVHYYLVPGSYNVKLTVTDIHECDETVTKDNFIHIVDPKAGFKIEGSGGCLNKVLYFTDTTFTPNTHNLARSTWDFGDGQSQTFLAPFPSTIPHVYTQTGNFYPFLIITDSVGCSDSIIYATPITINQPVARFFSPNYNTCIVDTVVFRNASSGDNLKYVWSFGDSTFSTAKLPLKQYATNGNYTVKLVVNDAVGCVDSLTTTNYINVKDVQASFKVSDSIGTCTPFEVSFTNTSVNGNAQSWEFGDGGVSTAVNPVYHYNSPGIYYAKLTSKRSNNCTGVAIKKIEVNSPTATLTYSPLFGCAPVDVRFHLSTTNKVSYVWDFDDGTSFVSPDSNVVHNYLLPGGFVPKVVLQDSGCFVSVIGNDSVKIFSSTVNFGVSDSSFCDTSTVFFSDSTISGSPVTGYRWDFGDNSTSTLQNPSHLYSKPGTYNVQLSISTLYGCYDSTVKHNLIKAATKPLISISGEKAYCGPSNIFLQGNLLNADTSSIIWLWAFSNGVVFAGQNFAPLQFNDTGTFNVQLIAINGSGCNDTAHSQIIVKPLPTTFAGTDTTICLGSVAQLHATGADLYEWKPALFLSCVNCNSPTVTPVNSNTYFVKGTNLSGCDAIDSVFVVVKKPFTISGVKGTDSVCAGKKIELFAGGAENYIWTPAEGINNAAISNPIIEPPISSVYKVVGFDSSNCFKDSASIYIKVNLNPTVNAGADIMLTAGKAVTLSPQYSPDIVTWKWQPSTALNCSDCARPIASPLEDVTYKIEVTNSVGCTKTDDIFIKVSCDRNNLFMPTAFTPNNDRQQLNETFYPSGFGIYKVTAFKIYNRYGTLVFENGNFLPNNKNSGWNGIYKGKPAPIDSYIYTVEFICMNHEVVHVNGNILLLR
jgi:gliding motility-associated-like protein